MIFNKRLSGIYTKLFPVIINKLAPIRISYLVGREGHRSLNKRVGSRYVSGLGRIPILTHLHPGKLEYKVFF